MSARYACCDHCAHLEDEIDNHEEPCSEGCNGVPFAGGAE